MPTPHQTELEDSNPCKNPSVSVLFVLLETASNGFSKPIHFQPIALTNAFSTEFLKTEVVPVMEPEELKILTRNFHLKKFKAK